MSSTDGDDATVTITRDDYYKSLVRAQFGENGIFLLTSLTFIFLVIIILLTISMSALAILRDAPPIQKSQETQPVKIKTIDPKISRDFSQR